MRHLTKPELRLDTLFPQWHYHIYSWGPAQPFRVALVTLIVWTRVPVLVVLYIHFYACNTVPWMPIGSSIDFALTGYHIVFALFCHGCVVTLTFD